MERVLKSIGFLVILALLGVGCSAKKQLASEATAAPKAATAQPTGVAGNWAFTISDTPVGNVEADLLIEKVEGGYKGYIQSSGASGKVAIEELKVAGDKVVGAFYSSEYGMDISFELDYDKAADTMSGYMLDSFAMKGKRKE